MIFGRSKSNSPRDPQRSTESAAESPDISSLLDAFGQVLSAYGRGGFDLPGRSAADVAAELEEWRLHAVLGTPIGGTPIGGTPIGGTPIGGTPIGGTPIGGTASSTDEEAATTRAQFLSAGDRDFRGAASVFSEHRRTEKRLTESALADLRDCLWTCVQRVHVAVQADHEADAKTANQIARVQTAIHAIETGSVKTEVLTAIAAMEQISRVRHEKQQSAYTQLAQQIEQLSEQLEDARRESETDTLTGLGNRKRFERDAARQWQLHDISRAPLTMVMMDLDGLKAINDSLGHSSGDTAIREFAQTLPKVFLRDADIQCRIGGDEFVVLLPNTNEQLAQRLTERLVTTVGELRPWGEEGPRLGVSAGVAQTQRGEDLNAWIARADAAMYRAKAANKIRAESAPALVEA